MRSTLFTFTCLPSSLSLLALLCASLAACSGKVEAGTGGSGGSGAGGGGSTGGPVCPATEPSGQPCDAPAVRCTYGDSVRPECRHDWTCLNGQWTTTKSTCIEPTNCPDAMPQNGADCSPEGDVCSYGATLCECNACSGGPCMQFPAWSCAGPPQTPGCPDIVPNDGTSCSQEGLECSYGNACGISGAIVKCTSGAWTWEDAIACPA